MTWEDIHAKDDNDMPAITTMICDFCGERVEGYNIHYDDKSQHSVDEAWKTDGWADIGIYQYNGDKDHPSMVEVAAITHHACPKCVKEMLGIVYDGTPYPKIEVS